MKPPKPKADIHPAKKTLECEIEALQKMRGSFGGAWNNAAQKIASCRGTIVTTGIGKSSYVAMKMAATFASYGITSHFMHPAEAVHGDSGLIGKDDLVIAFSFSGNSAEIIKMIRHIRGSIKVPSIAVTGRPQSTLALLADHVIHLPVSREGSPHEMAPMASVVASLAACDMLVSTVVAERGISAKSFARSHPGGSLGLRVRTVEELITTGKNVPLVPASASLRKAIRVVSSKRLGIAGMTDSRKRLVGVLTDGDLRRFLMEHDSINGFTASDAMTRNPKTVSMTDSLEKALQLMEKHKITSVFACAASRKVVGIIHIHDIVEHNILN